MQVFGIFLPSRLFIQKINAFVWQCGVFVRDVNFSTYQQCFAAGEAKRSSFHLQKYRHSYYYESMKIIPLIYENDEIAVIDKPAGIAVQGGSGIVHSIDRLLPVQRGHPVYLVHRLDRDTAGLLITAKNPAAAAKWTKLIGEKCTQKEYTAVCAGDFRNSSGVIKTDIVQHGKTKRAETQYTVLRRAEAECGGSKITLNLVRLQLATGRMHQIRIHLAQMACPIAGDDKHGNFALNRLLKKHCGIKQLLLASDRLTIPLDAKPIQLTAPLPAHITAVLKIFFPDAAE